MSHGCLSHDSLSLEKIQDESVQGKLDGATMSGGVGGAHASDGFPLHTGCVKILDLT